MSNYSYKTIMLKGQEFAPTEEAKAGEAGIYPGMFLKFQSDGDFELQDESETIGPMLIAVEDDNKGGTIDTVYTSGENALARWVPIGAEVFAYLAPGHNASIGSYLSFAGYEYPGALGVAQQTSAQLGTGARFVAKEAVNNSAGLTAVRIVAQRMC
jgi:hypothetical protein